MTKDVAKVGVSCCRMSRSWQLGVEVAENIMRECKHRRSFRRRSSWKATCSRTDVCHVHHRCCDYARIATERYFRKFKRKLDLGSERRCPRERSSLGDRYRRGESAGDVGGGAPRASEHARRRGTGSAGPGAQGASPGVGFAGARLGAGLAPEAVRAEGTSGGIGTSGHSLLEAEGKSCLFLCPCIYRNPPRVSLACVGQTARRRNAT